MTYFFHIVVGTALIIFQTVIIPFVSLPDRFYDLMVPFVLYLGIYRSPFESIIIIIVLSFLMDSLSCAPFGLYGTTYLWLFVATRWGRQFLRVKNIFLLPLLILLGVLTENFIFFISFLILKTNIYQPEESVHIVIKQVTLAVLTGSFIPGILSYIYNLYREWLKSIFDEETD